MKERRNFSTVQWLLSLPGSLVLAMGLYAASHILTPNPAAAREKVTICHVPPGNPDNAYTISVRPKGAKRHFTNHDDTLGPCDPTVTTNTRPWLEEADFAKDPTLYAKPRQVIVFDLEPEPTDTVGYLTSTIRYLVSETATFNFCIPQDEPYIKAIELVGKSGNIMMHHDGGDECSDVTIPAGKYTMHLFHDGSLIDAAGKKAFLHQPQQPRLLGDIHKPYAAPDFVTLRGPNRRFVTDNTPVGTNFVLNASATSVGPHEVWLLEEVEGARVPKYTFRDGNGTFAYFVSHTSTVVDSGNFWAYNDDKWWEYLIAQFGIKDLGNGQLQLGLNYTAPGNWITGPIRLASDNSLFWEVDAPSYSVFTWDYKGFNCGFQCDSSELTLNAGEVAFFAECNYEGPAIVFGSDVPDLSIYNAAAGKQLGIGDDMIASVRVGPDTLAFLYPNIYYDGTSLGVGVDVPCLKNGKIASSFKITNLSQYILMTNACENCILTGIDLSTLDLTDGNFTGSVFLDGNFNKTIFTDAELSRVDFSGAKLTDTVFHGANLEDATFSGAGTVLAGTDFTNGSKLYCTSFSNADLSAASFDTDPEIKRDFSCRLDVSGATLDVTTIEPAVWRYLDLTSANILNGNGATLSTIANPLDLSGAILSGTKGLAGVFLDGANLGCATDVNGIPVCSHLINTNLNKASLQQAVLEGALLNGSNLNYTNLEQADLFGAQLLRSSALISAASLEGAYLKNANLAQADLSGVDLSNANFYSSGQGSCAGVQWSGKCASAQSAMLTSSNFTDAYLSGVDFSDATLQGANFKHAVLLGALFLDADLSQDAITGVVANFGGAFLQGADFTDATVTNASFNNAYVDLLSSSGGLMAFKLPAGNLEFADCEANNRSCTGCVFSTYNGITEVPWTTNANICPDGTNGPCTDSKWQDPFTPIEEAPPPSSSDIAKLPGGCSSLDFSW